MIQVIHISGGRIVHCRDGSDGWRWVRLRN